VGAIIGNILVPGAPILEKVLRTVLVYAFLFLTILNNLHRQEFPPVICFAPIVRRDGSKKDTLHNIEATGEFVVNVVSEEFAAKMNVTSGEYPPDVDEFALSGLTPVASEVVKAPRVKESHVNMECRLMKIVPVSERPGGGCLVLGEVVRFHVDDAMVSEFAVDPDQLGAVGRMGGATYSRTVDRFELERPK